MTCPKTLLKAVGAGRTRQVRLLLELGASVNDYDECGQTPLIKGIFLENDRNRDKIVKMLLKRGTVVSRTDVVGRNALMWACIYGRDTDVSLIIEYADVDLDYNAVDINGQTALFHAMSSGNAATVKLIVQALNRYDLSVDIPNARGVTPLMHATRLGHDVCASILIYEGRAKVGIGELGARKEKWAISSLRERSKVKKNPKPRQGQFPPIMSGAVASHEETRASLRNRQAGGRGPVDSDTELDSGTSTDEDSYCLKNDSFVGICVADTVTDANPLIKNCLQNVPQCKIPQSLLTPLSVSASDLAASGDESEVDSIASTIVDGKPAKKSPVDLASMYNFKQEQMCNAYRQTAVKEEEEPGIKQTEEVDKSTMTQQLNDINEIQTKKWQHLKKGLRLTGISKHRRLKNASCSVPVTEKVAEPQNSTSQADDTVRPGVFPSIYSDKKVHLVQTASPRIETQPLSSRGELNRNYSEM